MCLARYEDVFSILETFSTGRHMIGNVKVGINFRPLPVFGHESPRLLHNLKTSLEPTKEFGLIALPCKICIQGRVVITPSSFWRNWCSFHNFQVLGVIKVKSAKMTFCRIRKIFEYLVL